MELLKVIFGSKLYELVELAGDRNERHETVAPRGATFTTITNDF